MTPCALGALMNTMDMDDYYNVHQAPPPELVAFDCGSSGTKQAGERYKAVPTMTTACKYGAGCDNDEDASSADRIFAAARNIISARTDEKNKDAIKAFFGNSPYETLRDKVPDGSICFAVATAGNRIVEPKSDKKAWQNFKELLEPRCNLRSAQELGFFTHDIDSSTAAGTQEAVFELATYGMSFLSAGGASAQFAFYLCDDEVADEWKKTMASDAAMKSQCKHYSESDARYFTGTVSNKIFEYPSGKDLMTPPEPEKDMWAVGSFLGCHETKTTESRFAGVNQALLSFRKYCEENDKCKQERDASPQKKVKESHVKSWLEKDDFLGNLSNFTDTWRTNCRKGASVGKPDPRHNNGDNVGKNNPSQVADQKTPIQTPAKPEVSAGANSKPEEKNAGNNADDCVQCDTDTCAKTCGLHQEIDDTATAQLHIHETLAAEADETVQQTGQSAKTTGINQQFHTYKSKNVERQRFVLATQAAGGIDRKGQGECKAGWNAIAGFVVENLDNYVELGDKFGGNFAGIMVEKVLEILKLTDSNEEELVPFNGNLNFIDTLKIYVSEDMKKPRT